jgi:hypothetical protein
VEPLVLHTTRGTLEPRSLDEARELHDGFVGGGPQPGIEVARSLGDLSHAVYAAARGADGLSDAAPDELLFVDHWAAPEGMEAFFAHPSAREAGDRLCPARVEAEWRPASGAAPLQFPPAADHPARFLVLVQAPVPSAEAATTALAEAAGAVLGPARRRGQLTHQLFVRYSAELAARPAANARHGAAPGPADAPVQVLAMSSWPALDGLCEHHRDPDVVAALERAAGGPVAVSVWEQVGGFVEW